VVGEDFIKFIILFASITAGYAQIKNPPLPLPAPTSTTVASAGVVDNFYTIGVLYESKASPHYEAWVAEAKCISTTSKTYSFSGIYITIDKMEHPVTSITTGIAQYGRDLGSAHLYFIGGAGMGVTGSNSGTSLSTALNTGIFAVIPLKKEYSLNFFIQELRVNGGNNLIFGTGFGWGK
jgi:hypothetical protein